MNELCSHTVILLLYKKEVGDLTLRQEILTVWLNAHVEAHLLPKHALVELHPTTDAFEYGSPRFAKLEASDY